jgi:hypothetical protein
LIYHAGVKTRPNVVASKQWNYEKESQIKQTLKTWGMPSVRGHERIGISEGNFNAFKQVVAMPIGEATKKNRKGMLAAIKSDGIIKKSDGVLEIVRHLKSKNKGKTGEVSYEMKWRNPQIETHQN